MDADGRVYGGNLVLAVGDPRDAQALLAGDLNLPGPTRLKAARADCAAFAAEIFGKKAAAAGHAADALAEKILLG